MITVIIPVYNLRSVLDRCVKSVFNQSFFDWNMILVDDGSTDGSNLLCDQYAQADSRITVIHQNNQGAAGARNTGIEVALERNTDYIIFLDGDDWWDDCLLEKMMERINHDHTLLAACGFYRIDSDGNILESSKVPCCPTVWNARECYKHDRVIGTGPTNKLIAASLLQHNRFPEGKLFEDEFFTYKLLYFAKRVSIVNEHLYYYCQRPGSLTHLPITAKGIGDKMEALYGKAVFFMEQGEKELEVEAKEKALVANAKAVIVAIQNGRYSKDEFPKKYRMTKIESLYYIHKYCPENNYSYFLSKLYPNGVKIHNYLNQLVNWLRSLSQIN